MSCATDVDNIQPLIFHFYCFEFKNTKTEKSPAAAFDFKM